MSRRPALLGAAGVAAGTGAAVLAARAVRARRRTTGGAAPAGVWADEGWSGAGVPLRRLRPRTTTGEAHVLGLDGEPDWVAALAAWVPDPPATPVGRVLARVWAGPVTLAGLLVGLLAGVRPEVRDGVIVFAPARGLVRWALRRRGFVATTLGHVVIGRVCPGAALWAHELVHTRQAERLGPLMAPVYWGLLLRYGYARHPMERAARRAGRAVRLAAASA